MKLEIYLIRALNFVKKRKNKIPTVLCFSKVALPSVQAIAVEDQEYVIHNFKV